jgi:hypothetical protein
VDVVALVDHLFGSGASGGDALSPRLSDEGCSTPTRNDDVERPSRDVERRRYATDPSIVAATPTSAGAASIRMSLEQEASVETGMG